MAFVYWARKVLSKWIWLLGFVPLLSENSIVLSHFSTSVGFGAKMIDKESVVV